MKTIFSVKSLSLYLTVGITLWLSPGLSSSKLRIPIGTIFSKSPGWKDVFEAMNIAVEGSKDRNGSADFDMKFYVDKIDTVDAYKLTKIICTQFDRGVYSLMGSVDPESFDTLHSFSNAFEMPFVTPWYPEKVPGDEDNGVVFGIQMKPEYHQAIVDLIVDYGWTSVIYIYQSTEGLNRLQKLYDSVPKNGFGSPTFHITTAKKIYSANDAISFVKELEYRDRESIKHIILDCETAVAQEIIVKHVQTIVLGRRNYHYLMAGLVMDEIWDGNVQEYGAINITGLRVVHYESEVAKQFFKRWNRPEVGKPVRLERNSISAEGALAYDIVTLLIDSFNILILQAPETFRTRRKMGREKVQCGNMTGNDKPAVWEHGQTILRYIKSTHIDGLTGPIWFDKRGKRTNFTMDILEMTSSSQLIKRGTWGDRTGLITNPTVALQPSSKPKNIRTQTFLMTTILEEPYMMLTKPRKGVQLTGNDRYEGYCKDLADLITSLTGIQFEIQPVKDGKYGSPDNSAVGGWNGMVGELVRREAEIAIAPLTINSQREQVADFTKPFMSLGISIMIKAPVKQRPGVFTFMNPLSPEIWMCVLFAYIGVSIVLFLVSRFSPYEWQIEENIAGTTVSNHFSVINSLWFALGAFMQQGIDITPRSISGRIVGYTGTIGIFIQEQLAGGVWWFFSLILISTYTANLAAFLTVDRMVMPINSADDLAAQTEIEYGALEGGSTVEFLKNSKIAVYSSMWAFMSSRSNVLTPTTAEGIQRVRESKGRYAFLIESSTNEYVNERQPCDTMKVGKNLDAKGYGIATARGSGLRDVINLAVLNLTENGDLAKLKNKWWYDRSECKKEKAPKNELSLSHLAGIFYILIFGLVLAMLMALVEFCYKASTESKKAKVPMSDAMKNKARLALSGGRDIDRIMLYGDTSAL